MKILVLGATGATGSRLMEQALDQGHFVTAAVRDPMKLNLIHDRLTIIRMNLFDRQALQAAVRVQDAVLSTLGPGRDSPPAFISKAMAALIDAMEQTSVRRLVFLSAFGVGETHRRASLASRLLLHLHGKESIKDKAIADDLLKRSTLAYTLVYPTALSEGPSTGEYRVGADFSPGFLPYISRADVADFMLRQLTDPSWVRKTVIVSY